MSTSSPEEALVPPSDESGAFLPGTGEQARRPTQAPRRPAWRARGSRMAGIALGAGDAHSPPVLDGSAWGGGSTALGSARSGAGLLRRGPRQHGGHSTRARHPATADASGDGRPLLPLGPGLTSRGLTARLPCLPGLPGEAGVSQSLANQGHSDKCHAVLRGGGGEGFSEISRLERHYSQAADRAGHAARFPRQDGSEPATSALHAAPAPRAGRAGTGPGDLPTRPGS